ncbi:MAG TPA: tetratricopeptide repeat protein [Candidatus Obscuribacterales bacterium]
MREAVHLRLKMMDNGRRCQLPAKVRAVKALAVALVVPMFLAGACPGPVLGAHRARPSHKGKRVVPFRPAKRPAAGKPGKVDWRATPSEGRAAAEQAEKAAAMNRAYSLRDQALNEQLSGDYGLAVRHLLEATQMAAKYYGKPSGAEALLYLDLARVAEQAGQHEVARQAYVQWLERTPSSPEARLRYSALLAKLGLVAEATSQARKAIELDPADPRAHLLLALLLERQGKLEEARAARVSSRALLEARPASRPPEPQGRSGAVADPGLSDEESDEVPMGLP